MRTLAVPIRRVDALAFAPDGAELAVCGVRRDHLPGGLLVGPPDGSAPFRQLLPGATVVALAYSADGRRLLVGAGVFDGEDGGVFCLDRRAPAAPLARLPVGCLFTTAADRLLATTVDFRATGPERRFACRRLLADGTFGPLWDVTVPEGDYTVGGAVLPDSRAVTLTHTGLTADRPSVLTLTLRAADTGRPLATVTPPGRAYGPLLASPDGRRVVLNAGGSLYLWRLADFVARPLKVTFGRQHCTGLGFLPDGYLLAAGNDGTVRRLDPDTGATVATHTFAAGKVRSLAVAPDGLTAAAGTDRGTVVVFDLD